MSYTFGPNETITFSDGNIETITGGFTVDIPVTTFGLVADVTLAGAGPESGEYFANITIGSTVLELQNAGATLFLAFASPFGAIVDPVESASWIGGTGHLEVSTSVTAVATAAVPEIKTWAMMLLGFAGIGFMAYRRKNKMALA